jgi:hypothetical protein
MATVIDALLVTLGLDSSEFKEGVRGATESLEGLIGTFGGLFAMVQGWGEFKEFIESTVKGRAELEDLGSRLNVATHELQVWQNAATIATGSASGLNSSLESLNGMVALLGGPLAQRAIRRFQNFSPAFTEAALKGKDALQVFDMVIATANKMQADGKASNIIAAKMMRMGISKDVVDMWLDGSEAIADYRKRAEELGTISQENIEASEKQEQSWNQLSLTLKKAKDTIYDMLAPAIKWVTGLLNEFALWAKKHPQVIRVAFMGIAAAVGVLSLALGLLAVKAALAMVPIAVPLLVISVAIGLIVAGITWLVQKWKAWNDAGRETTTVLGKFFATITEVFMQLRNTVMGALMSIWDMIKDYVQLILDQVELVAALFSGDADRIKAAWKTLCQHLGEFFNTFVKFILLEMAIGIINLTRIWEKFFSWIEKKLRTTAQNITKTLVTKIGGEELGKQYSEALDRTNAIRDKLSLTQQLGIGWQGLKAKVSFGKDVLTSGYTAGRQRYEASQKTIETNITSLVVNAPNATDSNAIAATMQEAISTHPLVAQTEAN